ncbi:MAG: hypothetical protein M1831_001316 [Alyxoria varia]|nr:MAG: hypothetical protein M1831_001316 [Alyxoria varia]
MHPLASWLFAFLLLWLQSSVVSALYADEAGTTDFHLALFGLPTLANTFFHQPYQSSKATLVYTLSERGVIGAVNPKDGAIVWRQPLKDSRNPNLQGAGLNTDSTSNADLSQIAKNGSPGRLIRSLKQDVVISSIGDTITAWSGADGRLVWERRFPVDSVVKDIVFVEDQKDAPNSNNLQDVVVLVEGEKPGSYLVDGSSGKIKWFAQDTSGDTLHKISNANSRMSIISLHKTMLKGYKIHISTIDIQSGRTLEQVSLNSESDLFSPNDIVFAGDTPNLPIIAWTDAARSAIKISVLGQKSSASHSLNTNGLEVKRVVLHAPERPSAAQHFLVHVSTSESHWAQVFHLDTTKTTVSKAFDLPNVSGPGVFSVSHVGNDVYFTRITEDEVTLFSSKSQNFLARWSSNAVRIPGVTEKPELTNAASEVVVRPGPIFAVRSAVLLSSGDWVMYRGGDLVWTRPEALAGILKAEWADYVRDDHLVEDLEAESHSHPLAAYIHRVRRHVFEAQDLPAWLQGLPQQAVQWVSAFIQGQNGEAPIIKDLGFTKVLVTVNDKRRLVALDTVDSGRIIWNEELPKEIKIPQLLSEGSLVSQFLSLKQTWKTKLSSSITNQTIGFRPSSPPKTHEQMSLDNIITYTIRDKSVVGLTHQKSTEAWRFTPLPNQEILKLASPSLGEPIASIGKPLHDRRVLYKYLDPNALLVISANHAKHHLTTTLLNAASGSILHTATHRNVDTSRPVSAAVSENWFAYSFVFDASAESTTSHGKGPALAIAELYESDIPNDRGSLDPSSSSSTPSNYSAFGPARSNQPPTNPHVFSQVYHTPAEIAQMAVTQTAQGITTRQLLVAAQSGGPANIWSLYGVPRALLDPRRPVGRDPSGGEQSEEGLMRYSPFLDLDGRWCLTHRNELLGGADDTSSSAEGPFSGNSGIRILTTPTVMESTSLVLAYGPVDVWVGRVNPSAGFDMLSSSFNKVQLVLTIVGLLVATLFVSPVVGRKRVGAMWAS